MDEEEVTIICAACRRMLGRGTKDLAVDLARSHVEECPATKEEYEQAIFDLKFRSIIRDLKVDSEFPDDE